MAANGNSGFLGALVAGFAAGYIIKGLICICEKLPEALEKIAPVLLYPLFGILIIGLLMNFVIEPVMGAINGAMNSGLMSMSGSSKIILGMILGGMMAIDMGGPFNKAAYVFGTAAIAAGNYDIMAAVMIGGMVPPCAIALATLLFKDKFTKRRAQCRTDQLYYGSGIHYRGCNTICGSRSDSCTSGMYHRFGSSRSIIYGIPVYIDGTAWRNLRISGSW